jgi:hypothetical protein
MFIFVLVSQFGRRKVHFILALKAHTHRTRFGDFRGAARTEINQFIEIAVRCTHWTRYGKNSQGDFGKFALRAIFFALPKYSQSFSWF